MLNYNYLEQTTSLFQTPINSMVYGSGFLAVFLKLPIDSEIRKTEILIFAMKTVGNKKNFPWTPIIGIEAFIYRLLHDLFTKIMV